jgi:prevent-host-death family protein
MEWQFAEAKNKLSEVFDKAVNEGPQKVTRRGRPAVIIITEEDLEHGKKPRRDFKEFLLGIPDMSDLDLERDKSPMRDVDLG